MNRRPFFRLLDLDPLLSRSFSNWPCPVLKVEFANIFSGFGVEVTQIYRGDLFLRGFELECRELLAEEMRSHGIDLRFNCNFVQIAKNSDGSFTTELSDGSTITTDMVSYPTYVCTSALFKEN